MWRDVSGTVGGGGSNGRWTVVSSDRCVTVNKGAWCDMVSVPMVAVPRGVVVGAVHCHSPCRCSLCNKSLVNEKKDQKTKRIHYLGSKRAPFNLVVVLVTIHHHCSHSTHGLTVDEELVNKKRGV